VDQGDLFAQEPHGWSSADDSGTAASERAGVTATTERSKRSADPRFWGLRFFRRFKVPLPYLAFPVLLTEEPQTSTKV